MDKREFIKQVYKAVWGENARPRQFIIDGIKKETYTYEETIEKIEAHLLYWKNQMDIYVDKDVQKKNQNM